MQEEEAMQSIPDQDHIRDCVMLLGMIVALGGMGLLFVFVLVYGG